MPELDMRTVSFLVAFFSMTFGVGLLFFHFEQKRFKGIKLVALAQICMSIGIGLISLRDQIPMWVSVLVSNMALCAGMTLALFGFCQFRRSSLVLCKISLWGLGVLLGALFYFYYIEPSINSRAVVISLQLGLTQLMTCIVIYQGKAIDSPLPKNTLTLAFGLVSITMFTRAALVMHDGELYRYMDAGWVHQVPYLASMFLIMAMSFNSVWLVNGRLTRSIEAISIKDNLTSLYNRRGMDNIATKMTVSAAEKNLPLVAMMCDIDHFKAINDQFGHLVGDKVIVQVSQEIRHQVRANDVAIRYGGEEFLIILPNTPLQDAYIVAERIRVAVQAIPPVDKAMQPISVSIGVSQQKEHQDLDSLISATDDAMYQAKQRGRNCVVLASDELAEIKTA
ncbi:GGDEF domain-containing protein [Vibrio ponticus]|uniref:diguanylate cyclase n=1 Tax=Vibrio ponticus TaxID=265668 RepID=A0A3N3DXK5_9VIBR|nr:GGDEF domain-containing protein [Vibrio ponticus]ROV59109.1 GGDEF domain-containing protein [Vibrio ponticus]